MSADPVFYQLEKIFSSQSLYHPNLSDTIYVINTMIFERHSFKKHRMIILVLALLCVLGVLYGSLVLWSAHNTPSQLGKDGGVITLTIGDVSFNAELALSTSSRAQGLSGRVSLPQKDGMLFIFSKSARHLFWMQGMLFDLDFVWINNGRVVDITKNVPAPTNTSLPAVVRPSQDASMVLELTAGSVTLYNIAIGNTVSFENK